TPSMKPSIKTKLERLVERHEEVGRLLSDPDVIGDSNRFRDLSREYARLEPVTRAFTDYRRAADDHAAAEQLLEEKDAELRAMGEEELHAAKARMEALEPELLKHLLPRDPHDDNNVFLEIRAGTGGDEAAIFAGDLHRM